MRRGLRCRRASMSGGAQPSQAVQYDTAPAWWVSQERCRARKQEQQVHSAMRSGARGAQVVARCPEVPFIGCARTAVVTR
jgi:hypothetical protein